jgi:hypothetical protein
MDILSTHIYKAQKQHKCNFCNGKISIGERYVSCSIVSDGFYIWKSHLRCDKIANKLNMYNDYQDEGLTSDSFQEFICEEYKNLSDKNESFENKLNIVCNHHLIQK